MNRIMILNQFKTDNIGDKLINKVLLDEFQEYEIINKGFEEFGKEIDVETYGDKKNNYPLLLRVFNKIGLNILKMRFIDYLIGKEIIAEIKGIDLSDIDLAIIGGGALIENNARFNSALKKWVELFKSKNIPIVILGVSGEIVSPYMAKRYKKSLGKCSLIVVRDAHTRQIVSDNYGIDAMQYSDVAFLLDTKKYLDSFSSKNLLNVQIYFKPGEWFNDNINEYFEFIKTKIYEEKDRHKKIVLTYTTHEDRNAAIYFLEHYHLDPVLGKIELIETNTVEEYMKVLTETKTLISGRMHAMITALLYKCEIIPLIVNEKINTFNEEYVVKQVEIEKVKDNLNELIGMIKEKYIEG